MNREPLEILKEYWGYEAFRPSQLQVIEKVLAGEDLLALMATGGGKSLCFQVPALCKPGVCIVVSPLLALMKDQVDRLNELGIEAHFISSAQSFKEIDVILDKCVYKDTKFLYISPERISNELFRERFKRMKVNLIAIDEAHCISQWGHDFRPAYRNVGDLRTWHPDVPVLALSASATPEVATDICTQMDFDPSQIVRGDMRRDNLSLAVVRAENKWQRLLQICQKQSGTGVIYARSRRNTKEIANFLIGHGVSASFYHAGLTHEQKSQLQEEWLSGKVRVIVSTNAFGMGIDKADVRFVAHADVPDNLEAYMQEAGRAGRDGASSWAILLLHPSDIEDQEAQLERRFPEPEFIRKVYEALGNHFQLAVGSGLHESMHFSLIEFARKYKWQPLQVLYSLEVLSKSNYIQLSEGIQMPSRLHLTAEPDALYNFQVRHPDWDAFVRLLLRTYGGLFEGYVRIRESQLAYVTKWDVTKIKSKLHQLTEMGMADYAPAAQEDRITWIAARQHAEHITFPPAALEERKDRMMQRWNAMLEYLNTDDCRENVMMAYFGQEAEHPCGHCDNCIANNTPSTLSDSELSKEIQRHLSAHSISAPELCAEFPLESEARVIEMLRILEDEGQCAQDEDGLFSWASSGAQ